MDNIFFNNEHNLDYELAVILSKFIYFFYNDKSHMESGKRLNRTRKHKYVVKIISGSNMVLPIFFQAIQIALMVEIKRKLLKIIVQIIAKFLLQAITEQRIIQKSEEQDDA